MGNESLVVEKPEFPAEKPTTAELLHTAWEKLHPGPTEIKPGVNWDFDDLN